MSARRAAALSFGLVSLVADGAWAQASPRVALTWTAPAECPAPGAVVAEVDRILGEKGARPKEPLAVSATVVADASGYAVDVRTAGAEGPRSRALRGKTCSAVADATALVIALAIDPTAVAPERPTAVATGSPAEGARIGGDAVPSGPASPSSEPVAPPSTPKSETPVLPKPIAAPPKIAAKPASPAPDRETPPPRSTTSLKPSYRLEGWAGGEVGALPSATGIFGGEVGIVLVNFKLMLGGEGLFPNNKALTTSSSAKFGLAAATLDVGYTFHLGAFELGPLAGFEIGSVSGSTSGVTKPGSRGSLWDAARAGGFASWFPLRHFGLTSRLEAAFPFSRPNFTIPPAKTPVHQPGRASGRLVAGVEARF